MFKKILDWIMGKGGSKGLPSITYHDALKGKSVIYYIEKSRIQLGRASTNDVTILDPNNRISRRHAALLYLDGHWMIEDLNSSYGVYVNGERVQGSQVVQDGDKIHLADLELKFYTPLTLPSRPFASDDEMPTLTERPAELNAIIAHLKGSHEQQPTSHMTLTKGEQPSGRVTLVKEEQPSGRVTLTKGEQPSGRVTLVKEDDMPTEPRRMTLLKPDTVLDDEELRRTVKGDRASE